MRLPDLFRRGRLGEYPISLTVHLSRPLHRAGNPRYGTRETVRFTVPVQVLTDAVDRKADLARVLDSHAERLVASDAYNVTLTVPPHPEWAAPGAHGVVTIEAVRA